LSQFQRKSPLTPEENAAIDALRSPAIGPRHRTEQTRNGDKTHMARNEFGLGKHAHQGKVILTGMRCTSSPHFSYEVAADACRLYGDIAAAPLGGLPIRLRTRIRQD